MASNPFSLAWDSATLLLQASTNEDSPGPLQLSAMILEVTSLSFMFVVLLQESDGGFEEKIDEDSCPVDAYDLLNGEVDGATDLSATEIDKLKRCMELEEEERRRQQDPSIKYLVEEEEEEEKRRESGDSPAVVS